MTSRTNIMVSNKLFRLLTLSIFLVIVVNPDVWSIVGFTAPELSIDIYFIYRLLCVTQEIGIFQTILGVFVASILFFIYNSIVYKNSPLEKLGLNLKDWESILPTILHQYLFILIQCALWSVVFVLGLLFDLLPDGLYMKGLTLGSFIAIVNILPICFKTWIEATYPNKSLAIELAKGLICGYIIGFSLVSFIWYLPYGQELNSYGIKELLEFIIKNIGVEGLLRSIGDLIGAEQLSKFVTETFGNVGNTIVGTGEDAVNTAVDTANKVKDFFGF